MEGLRVESKNTHSYCLKWNDYEAHVLGVLLQLLQAETMVDVTLCASGGEKIHAHRIVLCACSNYFQEILSQTGDNHPFIILSEMSVEDVQSVLEFMYRGELNVDASRFNTVLQVAEALQIRGLMEVSSHLPDLETTEAHIDMHTEELVPVPVENDNLIENAEVAVAVEVCDSSAMQHCSSQSTTLDCVAEHTVCEEQHQCIEEVAEQTAQQFQPQSSHEEEEHYGNLKITVISEETLGKKKRKRRETCRKEYSEEQLAAALADLSTGHLLVETAAAHRIPRSTLYVRAKAAGIPITVTRQEHSGERVNAAVQAVTGGASLQQASALYQIPKTVLWRRVRAAGGRDGWSSQKRQTYGLAHRQAAVQALQNGQNLSRVSAQFQIPKTTLFREKARLVEAGKLPWSSLKRRDPESCALKQTRIKEAVAACKEGKMSQAVASITYKVPKTTIWRRLQKGVSGEMGHKIESTALCVEMNQLPSAEEETDTTESRLQEQVPFGFCENTAQIPVSYIVGESDFSETQLII